MSHHIIDISAPSCTITCRRAQLICRPENAPERAMPFEDIGAVLINSFSALIHNRVFVEAARQGTVVIFCEKFRPVSLLLPANRSTDTLLTRAQLHLAKNLRQALWQKTVNAKCANQALFARDLVPASPQTARLIQAANSPKSDKEANCARLYWAAYSSYLGLRSFKRQRQGEGLNNLLNYAYTVLLARLLQKTMAVGIDPACGIAHVVRERAAPLAYDLMEPFRIAIDLHIAAWIKDRAQAALQDPDNQPSPFEVTQEFKRWAQQALRNRLNYQGKNIKLENTIELVVRGFRQAVLSGKSAPYKPWLLENTKWVGSS